MKRLLYLSIVVLIVIYACSQKKPDSFSVKIDVKGLDKGDRIFLYVSKNKSWKIIDTVIYDETEILFNGSIDKPRFGYIIVEKKGFGTPFFLENADIRISGNVKDRNPANIEGSPLQDKYYKFYSDQNVYYVEYDKLYKKYEKGLESEDEEIMEKFDKESSVIEKKISDFILNYILDHPDNIVTLKIINENIHSFDFNTLKKIEKSFKDTSIKNSSSFNQIKRRLVTLEKSAIGKQFLDFTTKDLNGKKVKFSSFIGKKYVLLDFWASWCIPCRKENPNILKVYNKYKDKGFDVVAVSLNKDKDKWLKAIKEDGLPWHHISDLLGWNSYSVNTYGVSAVPHSVLISPEGKIIAKNLRGRKLKNYISNLLDK